jgi:ribosome-binding factor A
MGVFMNNQRRWQKNATVCCTEFDAEDGIDPRYLVTKHARKKSSRKELQLCKEATRIVSLVLTGETGQPLLRDLQVLSVHPEQDGSSVCVSVGHYATDIQVSDTEVLEALKRVQGLLRTALAHALHRKHTPTLSFHYVGVLGKGGT